MNWRTDAVCVVEKVPVDVFVLPLGEEEPDAEATRAFHARAKSFCRRCPVVDDCLEYALAHFERSGVWGNTTPRERRVIWRDRRMEEFDGNVGLVSG